MVAAGAKRRGQTPVEYMLSVMRDPLAAPERRDQMAMAVANYVHPKFAVVEQKVEQTTEMRVSLEELAKRAEAEIDAAFREWTPPLTIEHQPRPVDEPAVLPETPVEKIEPAPVRDYALEPLGADPTVTRLPRRDYRPARTLPSKVGY
jgi:hypothetical protein